MKPYEREILLERISKESATVGASIPDRIAIQGEEIDLQEFVFEIKRRDTVPPGERDRVEIAKKNLRRERLARKQRIEDEDLDIEFEEGEELARAIIGIDRALNALEGLDSRTDLETEQRRQEAMDQKRWVSFLKKALGRDDGPRIGGR
ncbi:DUF5788 family protein [Halorarius litoreus]|uniref:DUF5788 family protein n=1 Tax=Halorarius litoreus TaxID=2962676 RepID=UPI0020CCB6E3|nr:DUF5788 family protein [Halorarius litoreus]